MQTHFATGPTAPAPLALGTGHHLRSVTAALLGELAARLHSLGPLDHGATSPRQASPGWRPPAQRALRNAEPSL
jgi:hypothetical protein